VGGGRGRKSVGQGKGEGEGTGRGGQEGGGLDPPNFETVVAPLLQSEVPENGGWD
jgi:hypothetical protein